MFGKEFIIGFLFIVGGAIQLSAVFFKWGWFINFYRVRRIYDNLGEKGARIFYIIFGILAIASGVFIMIDN